MRQSRHDRRNPGLPFSRVFFNLLRRPQDVLFLWNWKAALLSICLRAPIFLVATIRRGWETTLAALLTETVFCALTAGFYGAIVQVLRDAEPRWLTGLVITVLIPVAFQAGEYLMHRLRGTPHLLPAEAVSVVISMISALFNWYAMRRGALLVGGEGASMGRDLRRLPRVFAGFLGVVPRWIARHSRDIFFKTLLPERD